MSYKKPELSFEIVYHDEDLIEVEVVASNGRYAGITKLYSNADGEELIKFGNLLQGFPKGIEQVIEWEFGSQTGMFYIGLKLFCLDKSGHTAVDIVLREDNWAEREEAIGKTFFELLFDPASLDQFVQELFLICERKEGNATLTGKIGSKNTIRIINLS